MTDAFDRPAVEDWGGALGPQSREEPAYYELELRGDRVLLRGSGLGMLHSFDRGEFEELVADGEWVLADEDPAREVYLTPDGERPF